MPAHIPRSTSTHPFLREASHTEAFRTAGGVRGVVLREQLPAETALDAVWKAIDESKGGLFISNYEAPNRYARWDIGFIHPPLEFLCLGRRFAIRALNGEGKRLLTLFRDPLHKLPAVDSLEVSAEELCGEIVRPEGFFTEEERSRQPSWFSVLRALLQHLRCEQKYLGLYGAFGYDLVQQFDPLPMRLPRPAQQVDCHLFLPTELIVVDRSRETALRYCFHLETPLGPAQEGGGGGERFPPPAVQKEGLGQIACDHAQGEFQSKVERIREGCRKGEYFEVVLSQTLSTPYAAPPTQLFRTICESNPSPYSFLINMGTEQLVGASPEMYVRTKGRRVETSPISGTVPIGRSPMETASRIKYLLSSEKEEAELTMCTDVDRNDLTRVCVPGSVRLIGRRQLEIYSRLVHTVDHLEGLLDERYDALDAFVTHLWACTVTGSPKPAALRAIEALENTPRRWYAGAVGYFLANGDLNSGMTLRAVHLENGFAHVKVGATLLYDSDPAAEERETQVKASAFLEAVLQGERARTLPPIVSPSQTGQGLRVLFVDFLDSFVHTLASYVRQTGAEVTTVRADFPDALFQSLKPDLVFLSPGPGTPTERGVQSVIARCIERHLPLFGVCLGLQGLAEVFGAQLGTLSTPMHGKPSAIQHNGTGIFRNLPNPFSAGRYHSLYVQPDSLPPDLRITARAQDGTIMGLEHVSLPAAAVQFHPESILSLEQSCGQQLICNLFTELRTRQHAARQRTG